MYLLNSIKTPDGTVLTSRHRHDYVAHVDVNGNTYAVDGGLDYLRRIGPNDYIELSVEDNGDHDLRRSLLKWGSYGKDGDLPLILRSIKSLDTEHIRKILADSLSVSKLYSDTFYTELELRDSGVLKVEYDINDINNEMLLITRHFRKIISDNEKKLAQHLTSYESIINEIRTNCQHLDFNDDVGQYNIERKCKSCGAILWSKSL